MPATKQTAILNDWDLEEDFAERWKEKTGFGSRVTLARWRRLGIVPKQLEWMRAGRAVLWREKPKQPETETASTSRGSP
jgi:hypothetical protein